MAQSGLGPLAAGSVSLFFEEKLRALRDENVRLSEHCTELEVLCALASKQASQIPKLRVKTPTWPYLRVLLVSHPKLAWKKQVQFGETNRHRRVCRNCEEE